MSVFERAFVWIWGLGVAVPLVLRANGYAIDIFGHSAALLTLAEIPTSCNDTCNAVLDDINSCATFQCLCTTTNTNGITACVDCLVAVKPSNQTVIDDAQDIINQYASLCNQGGITVPVQTASGFTGVVGSATGTGVPTNSFVSSGFSPSGSAITATSGVASASPSATATSPVSSSASSSPSAQSASTVSSPSPSASSSGAQKTGLGSWAVAGNVGIVTLAALIFPVF